MFFFQNLSLPTPPEDLSICTLWIGNVDPDITETDIYNAFFVYGPVVNIHMAKQSKCAFVEMGSRAVAEYALQQLYGALIVQGRVLSLHWARPRSLMDADAASQDPSVESGYMLPPPGMESSNPENYAIGGLAPPWLPPSSQSTSQPQPPLPPGPRPAAIDGDEPPVKRQALGEVSADGDKHSRPNRPAGSHAYPSMDPLRMGSKYGPSVTNT